MPADSIESPLLAPDAAPSRLTIGAVEWTFLDVGARDAATAPLLVLPGALGMVAGAGAALARLAEGRRVVALAYPAVETMTALCDGVAALLDRLEIGRVDVLGSSLGGWVAQCFARRHPARVRRLALSHTYALRPEDVGRLRFGTRVWTKAPGWLFRALLRARLRMALRPLRRTKGEEYERWMNRVAAAPNLTPAVLARYNGWMIESLSAFRFAPGDLPGVPVLIVDSDDDPILKPKSRAALRALYPSARVKTFAGTGHATSLVAPDAWAAEIRDFLDSDGTA